LGNARLFGGRNQASVVVVVVVERDGHDVYENFVLPPFLRRTIAKTELDPRHIWLSTICPLYVLNDRLYTREPF
jgi:hypothetical protein